MIKFITSEKKILFITLSSIIFFLLFNFLRFIPISYKSGTELLPKRCSLNYFITCYNDRVEDSFPSILKNYGLEIALISPFILTYVAYHSLKKNLQ